MTAAHGTSRAQAAFVVLAGVVGVALASIHTPSSATLLAALAAAALVGSAAAVAIHLIVAAPATRTTNVGHRSRAHRESMSEIAAPTHPNTRGRTRSRAPGEVIPALTL